MDYDLNGNLTHQGVWTYVYDAQNRLTSAISPTVQVDFAYDPKNRCVSRTVSTGSVSTVTYFYYDGWELIEEHDANATLLARYIHGAREDEMIAKIDSFGTVYYHTDAEGSVVALTDTSGNVIERYKYDAFGKPSFFDSTSQPINGSTVGNRFLFTGREWLPDLGLYDYRNRAYSPELGRFLQTDPKSFDADPSNLYRYCGNDPVDRTDPMGLQDDAVPRQAVEASHGPNIGGVTQQEDPLALQKIHASQQRALMEAAILKYALDHHVSPDKVLVQGKPWSFAPDPSGYAPGEPYSAERYVMRNYPPSITKDGFSVLSTLHYQFFDKNHNPVPDGTMVSEVDVGRVNSRDLVRGLRESQKFDDRTVGGNWKHNPDYCQHVFRTQEGSTTRVQTLRAGNRYLSFTGTQTIKGLDVYGTQKAYFW